MNCARIRRKDGVEGDVSVSVGLVQRMRTKKYAREDAVDRESVRTVDD